VGSRKHCFLKNQKRERLSRDYLSLIPHDDRTRRTKKKKRTLTYKDPYLYDNRGNCSLRAFAIFSDNTSPPPAPPIL